MEIKTLPIIGKIITSIDGCSAGSDRVKFKTSDGLWYIMYHRQDCCESVTIEDVIGDVQDLIGSPILNAKETVSTDNPPDIQKDYQESFTWTFYNFATSKGYVTVRWYGESKGYYSESVEFEKVY